MADGMRQVWQGPPVDRRIREQGRGRARSRQPTHNGAMSTLKETLQSDLTTAIRSRDELTSATLRMALTAVTTEEVAGTSARTLSDAEVMGVLTKEAKKRREAAAAFTDAARPELADREMAELGVLAPLPARAADGRGGRRAGRRRRGASSPTTGVTGMPAMGRVMKELTPQTAGRFDGGQLAAMVRAALG